MGSIRIMNRPCQAKVCVSYYPFPCELIPPLRIRMPIGFESQSQLANPDQIVFVESVGTNSKVAQLIAELKKQ